MFRVMSWKARRLLPIAMLMGVGACATAPEDRGASAVSISSSERGGPPLHVPERDEAVQARLVEPLLQRPLSADDAVTIALLRSPQLRIEYARLGLASADVIQAGRMSNPTLSASIMFPDRADEANQVGFGLATRFLDLLLIPARSRIAQQEFTRAQMLAGNAVLDLARDVESAYYALVGAQHIATMRQTVARSSNAAATLAQRYYDAGNLPDLQLSLEKSAAAQASLAALSARAEVADARARLATLMGLPSSESRWDVETRLPLPGAVEVPEAELQQRATERRLELQARRLEVASLRDGLGLTRSTSWFGGLEVGVHTERETDRSRITGPSLSWELPLFNQNQDGILRAQSALERAEAELLQSEIATGNDVARSYARLQNAREAIVLYQQQLLPMHERIVQRTQEKLDFMLAGVFELIRARQDQYDAWQAYLEAVRDYWLHRVDLQRAMGVALSSQPTGETVAPQIPQNPSDDEDPHRHHKGVSLPMTTPAPEDLAPAGVHHH